MLRSIYRLALRLHPHHFRQRFADEMLAIFDEDQTTVSGLKSLWMLLSPFCGNGFSVRKPGLHVKLRHCSARSPMVFRLSTRSAPFGLVARQSSTAFC